MGGEEEIKAEVQEAIEKMGRLSWDNLRGKPDEINHINKLLKEIYEWVDSPEILVS